jgi:hypothetical protein
LSPSPPAVEPAATPVTAAATASTAARDREQRIQQTIRPWRHQSLATAFDGWRGLLEALLSGAPVVWWSWLGVIPVAIGIYLFVRDPWIRRKLGLSGFFGRDAVIGAGWLLDEKGRTWTVDDTVVLVTRQGASVEVRLLHAERVHTFFLPITVTNGAWKGAAKPLRSTALGRARRAAADAVAGGAHCEPTSDGYTVAAAACQSAAFSRCRT